MEHWNNHRIIKLFLCCLLILSGNLSIAGIYEALAKEFFVAASNGKDDNIGTKEAPFLTLEKGVSVLSPGDILYVRGGTYRRTHYLWNPPSGISWTNAVTIKAYQNENVIVKPLLGSVRNTVFYLSDNSHQYLIMDGLTIDGTEASYGYRIGTGNHHIRVSNGEIKNTYNSGIQGGSAYSVEVLNIKIHDSQTSYGIYLPGSHWLIKNCDIYHNAGYGIHIYSPVEPKPGNNLIMNNKIYNNGWLSSEEKNGPHGRVGIIVTSGPGNQIINNVISGNVLGLQVDFGATNTTVFHNTLYSNDKHEILLGPYSKRSFVKNNLLVGTNADPVLIATNGSGASEIENNLIFGVSTNPDVLLKILDTSAISRGNLMGTSYSHGLKNPANSDFHLLETSSAIGAGLALTEVTTDLDGASRNPTVGFDVGAYQYNGLHSLEPPAFLRISNY